MMNILIFVLFSFAILFMHEVGHYIILKMFKIRIYKVGVSCTPLPHFYIRYYWPRSVVKNYIIIFSGSIVTLLGFLTLCLIGINHNITLLLLIAYYIQFIYETNPFHSDFLFASVVWKNHITAFNYHKVDFRSQIKSYMFSNMWYIHFVLWSILTIFLIKQMNLELI